MDKIKNIFSEIKNLFTWLNPFFIFLIILFFVKLFFLKNMNFNEFTELLKVLIWPFTVLMILFFFKKVVTFLFFSMNEFNFFGLKGNLKDVNTVILAEVNKKFSEEKKEESRKIDMESLYAKIESKDSEINKAKGTAEENLNIAKEIMKEWKKSTEQNKKTIFDLDTENNRLKEIVSNFPSNSTIPNIKDAEMGTGEKIEDLTLGNPK